MDLETPDHLIEATCECGKTKRVLTTRKLKNKWPHCECRLAMKVSDEFPHPEQRMGNARGITKSIRRDGNSD